jgi:hypothetical protein
MLAVREHRYGFGVSIVNPKGDFLRKRLRTAPQSGNPPRNDSERERSSELGRTLRAMPRERLTLEALVDRGTFDAGNHRHRRALDESGPLEDPQLEDARQQALYFRGISDGKVRGAEALRAFAELVNG